MDDLYLKEVLLSDKEIIIDYIREFYFYNSQINGVARLQDYITLENENFIEWFNKIKQEENAEFPQKTYLFVRNHDHKLIGMSNIRQYQDLKDYKYGHIGYSIRPTERNKGYGILQYYLDLIELSKIGWNYCIMNCNKNNIYSKKIIISMCGTKKYEIDNEEYYEVNIKSAINKFIKRK